MIDTIDSRTARQAQEAERRRIARELHDSTVQMLTALVADLECFRTHRFSDDHLTDQEMDAKLEAWQKLARESLLSMRETLRGLRGHGDLQFGLEAAVTTLLDDLQLAGYDVTFEGIDGPETLPEKHVAHLYSIIREALINITKHAQASKISVFMFGYDDHLHVSIGDDGLGMSEARREAIMSLFSPESLHQGLIGIRERATLLSGHLSITSESGKGTRLDIEVPLPPQELP